VSEELGAVVKERRKGLGLTLEDLAERSGVSRAMLSDVERGAKSPTIKVARAIAAGLGCSLSELVAGPGAAQGFVAHDRRPTLVDPETGIARQSIAPLALARGVEVLAFTFPPGTDTRAFPLHAPGTLKVVVVVDGRLEAESGREHHVLSPGDAFTFPSGQAYLLRNPGPKACTLHMAILHPKT